MDVDELTVAVLSENPSVGLRAALALRRLSERVEANQVALARRPGAAATACTSPASWA
jgi:hypothetical protein